MSELLLSQTSFFEILSTKFGKVSFSFLTFRLFQQEFVKEKDVKYPRTLRTVGVVLDERRWAVQPLRRLSAIRKVYMLER